MHGHDPREEPSNTIGELLAMHYGLSLYCVPCDRYVRVDLVGLAGTMGAQMTVGDIRRRATCTRCRLRGALTYVSTSHNPSYG